jgi:hypothetical protein
VKDSAATKPPEVKPDAALTARVRDSIAKAQAIRLKDSITNAKKVRDSIARAKKIIVKDSIAKADKAKDSLAKANKTRMKDSLAKPKPGTVKDSVAKPRPAAYVFKNNPDKPHYAILVLDKVDNIFVNEARNSFIIFNRSLARSPDVTVDALSADTKFILFGPFNNAADALAWTEAARAKAGTDIVPWLGKDKYSFIIINGENLQLLKGNKDIQQYKNFLADSYPGKF